MKVDAKIDKELTILEGLSPIRPRPGMYTDEGAEGMFEEVRPIFSNPNNLVEFRTSKAAIVLYPDGSSMHEYRKEEDIFPIMFSDIYSKITASINAATATTPHVTPNENGSAGALSPPSSTISKAAVKK